MIRSSSSVFKSSRKARTTPILAATPPWKITGNSNFLPLPILLIKFLATAKHKPATISWTGVAICCRWIMSLFANTLQRPAIRGGFSDFIASSPNSFSMEIPMRLACWSRKEPVPAAHILLRVKSERRLVFSASSSCIKISLESSPPISITVFTSG